VGRRADLFSLQKYDHMAQRRAAQVLSFQQQTLEARPRIEVRFAEDNSKCQACRTARFDRARNKPSEHRVKAKVRSPTDEAGA